MAERGKCCFSCLRVWFLGSVAFCTGAQFGSVLQQPGVAGIRGPDLRWQTPTAFNKEMHRVLDVFEGAPTLVVLYTVMVNDRPC